MNIYVGNLALEMTENELQREFIAFGAVTSVRIMNDKYIGSGQPRGYGFVEMASKSEGDSAIATLNGRKLKGRVVDVIEALPLSDKRDTGSFHGRKSSRFNGKTNVGTLSQMYHLPHFKRHIISYTTKEI